MGLGDVVDVFACCLFNWGALTTLLPAFLLAGALTAYVPATLVARYLGRDARRSVAFAVGATSGSVLPTCSCNIVPLFMSIRQAGAGLGPAIAFLYAGPAVNLVSTAYTFQLLGWRLGLWRAVGVPLVSVVLGLTMLLLFRRQEDAGAPAVRTVRGGAVRSGRLVALTLGVLFAVMLIGASPLPAGARVGAAAVLLPALGVILALGLDRVDLLDWLAETWRLVRTVVPLLAACVVAIGLAARAVPADTLTALLGDNDLASVLLASVFGALMYFPLLSEVVFTKTFLLHGVAVGPAFSVLLTGAGMSLPGLLLVRKVLGLRRTLVYMALLVACATAGGMLFGTAHGGDNSAWLLGFEDAPRLVGTAADTDGDGAANRISLPLDADGDGRPEQITTWVYDARGKMLEASLDRGADGRPDEVHRYEYAADGELTRETFDADGDGRPDRVWTPATGWREVGLGPAQQ